MNSRVAKRACQLSFDAYHTPKNVLVISKGTAKVIMVREDGFTWIAIEGTSPKLVDWLKNLWTT